MYLFFIQMIWLMFIHTKTLKCITSIFMHTGNNYDKIVLKCCPCSKENRKNHKWDIFLKAADNHPIYEKMPHFEDKSNLWEKDTYSEKNNHDFLSVLCVIYIWEHHYLSTERFGHPQYVFLQFFSSVVNIL